MDVRGKNTFPSRHHSGPLKSSGHILTATLVLKATPVPVFKGHL